MSVIAALNMRSIKSSHRRHWLILLRLVQTSLPSLLTVKNKNNLTIDVQGTTKKKINRKADLDYLATS